MSQIPEVVAAVCVLLIVLLVVALLACITSASERIERVEQKLLKRRQICTVVLTGVGTLAAVIFGGVLCWAVACQGNSIAQEQLEIAERESDPPLTLDRCGNNDDGVSSYTLHNDKGMASYISLVVREQYHFSCDGEGHEIDISFSSTPDSSAISIGVDQEITFNVPDYNFSPDEMEYAITRCLMDDYGVEDPAVYCDRVIEVDCFDHSNQEIGFLFNEQRDGEMEFNGLTSKRYIPERNIGIYCTSEDFNPYEYASRLLVDVME